MLRSMTAFARRVSRNEELHGELVWELRSVNHRYLEVGFRMPDEFRGLEARLREIATRRLGRGKLECTLRYRPVGVQQRALEVDDDLVQWLIDTTHRIEALMNNPARMSAIDVLQWPGVATETETDLTSVHGLAVALFDQTLGDLIESRSGEGTRIASMLEERARAVSEIVAQVRARRVTVVAAIREKLKTRLADLEVEPDSARLEQELVYLAQKQDVDEELDRLDSHCRELSDVLSRGEPVGRRLDFLMQEFNREANTLASKSADVETTRAAVDLKVLIEQMREQIQNVE